MFKQLTGFGLDGVRMVHAPSRAAVERSLGLDLAPILLLNMAALPVPDLTQVHKPATLKSASVSTTHVIGSLYDVTVDSLRLT